MRKMCCLLWVYLFPLLLCAQIRWDGEAGNGLWSDPLNWENNQLPGPADRVLIDHSFVPGNYTVLLPSGDTMVVVLQLQIQPAFPDSITLILPNTNTATPALQASASGPAISLGDRAVLINASGAASGTPVSVSGEGFFRIENGGHYIHRTERGHTAGLVSRLAVDAGTEAGIFEFDVPGAAAYTVSVSNRIYGHLVFSALAAGVSKTYTGAGINPLQVRSGLHIKSAAQFSYGSNVSHIEIGGDCRIDSGGTFNIANGANPSAIWLSGNLYCHGRILQTGATGLSTWQMKGNQPQVMAGKGQWQGQINLVINNAAGITLVDTLFLPGHLNLELGKVTTLGNAILWMRSPALVQHASESSFVDGRMGWIGANPFVFPIGVGGIFAPIGIHQQGADTDSFYAQYHRANPQSTAGVAGPLADSLHHISGVEYWELFSATSVLPRQISLFAGYASFVKDSASLLLAAREDGQWVSKGRAGFVQATSQPPWISGTLYASAMSNSLHYFTFGSHTDGSVNPLPLQLLTFTAHLSESGMIDFNWQCAERPSIRTRFRLGMRQFGRTQWVWDSLLQISPSTSRFRTPYQLGQSGTFGFILEIQEPGMEPVYSPQLNISWTGRGINQPLLYPNPAGDRLWLRWRSGPHPFHIRCLGMDGKEYWLMQRQGSAAQKDYAIPVSGLPAGEYLLILYRGNIFIERLRFSKRE